MSKQPGKHLYQTVSGEIFSRFFRVLFFFTVFLFLSYAAIFYYLRRKIWYGDEILYPFLHAVNENKMVFCISVWIVGFFIIFLSYWRKTLSYLDMIVEEGKHLAAEDGQFVHLPPELRAFEEKMNEAKMESMKNARNAKQEEQRKNDLIVYLAHDLKTPLTSVIGYLTLLQDEKEISESLQGKYLAVALEKAERLEDLINEFFEITRFNLTHLSLEKSRVNLTRMLEQIVFEFQPLFLEKGITCETFLEPDLFLVCDVDKMERVFDNLLRNAVNYCYEYGKITVQAARKTEDTLILTFQNTGKTIPEEKLERIFEQFFRLDRARGSASGGAGLGLAIAKEIVELHGGKIWARSEKESVEFLIEIKVES